MHLDGHLVPVAEHGVGLAVAQRREGGDQHTQGLGEGDQALALQVRVHLYLRTGGRGGERLIRSNLPPRAVGGL